MRLRGFPIRLPAFTGRLAHYLAAGGRLLLRTLWPGYHVWWLKRVIRELRPDLIHVIEFQHAGYMVVEARRAFADGDFPPVMVTSYGNDVYYFGRQAAHRARIAALLALAEMYHGECERDIPLVRELGFRGEVAPFLPCPGGFDLARYTALRQPGRPSARRVIYLKGFQGWSGRALCGLEAIAQCADVLAGYRVVVIPANGEVVRAARRIAAETGIPIETQGLSPHETVLRVLGTARVCIGLNISDGLPQTMLEGMVMGAFPIQSDPACAGEWFEDGENLLIVPPEDVAAIAAAIRTALSDDALVDRAAELNAQVARERLDRDRLKPSIVALYEHALQASNR